MRLSKLKEEYLSTLKSMDTEEHIDLYFYRPLGFTVAKISEKLGITPNVITVVSIFLGVGAGLAFYQDSFLINLLGILLLVSANTLDSADGQLARMTKNYSQLGRILDGMAGDLWFITIYIAICLRVADTSMYFITHTWAIWLLASLAGISHIKQAQMADYYRQLHLHFLGNKTISELEDTDSLKEKYAQLSWKSNFFKKLTMKFYLGYTLQQEGSTRALQQMIRTLKQKFPMGDYPEAFRTDFRAGSLPLMKYTNILSFNWRSFALMASILMVMPWVYFVIELVIFNAILLYMRARHEKLCRKLNNDLINGKYDR